MSFARGRRGATRGGIKAAPLVAALLLASAAAAAPQAELWARWERHDPQSRITVDHAALDDFLKQYRSEKDGVALLDYGGVDDGDAAALRGYIARLAATAVDELNRDEQRAFWINAYNALTINVILEHYPVDSIRDISSGFLSFGPWDEKLFAVGGERVSLNDIEHRILRPIWKDARLHYAVNCASVGCPNLAAVAYTAANSERLLDAGARAYVNHPRGAVVHDGRLRVSSIYDWFKADFGGDDAGVIRHLKQYAEAPLRAALDGVTAVADDDYDWSLNQR